MKHMIKHPLRETLVKDDWKRIQEAIEQKIPDHNVTLEEIEAAGDVYYDAIAAQKQTHLGSLTLQ